MDFTDGMLTRRLLRSMAHHVFALAEEVAKRSPVHTVDRITGIIGLQIRNPNDWVTLKDCTTGILRKVNTKVVIATFQQLFELLNYIVVGVETPIAFPTTSQFGVVARCLEVRKRNRLSPLGEAVITTYGSIVKGPVLPVRISRTR